MNLETKSPTTLKPASLTLATVSESVINSETKPFDAADLSKHISQIIGPQIEIIDGLNEVNPDQLNTRFIGQVFEKILLTIENEKKNPVIIKQLNEVNQTFGQDVVGFLSKLKTEIAEKHSQRKSIYAGPDLFTNVYSYKLIGLLTKLPFLRGNKSFRRFHNRVGILRRYEEHETGLEGLIKRVKMSQLEVEEKLLACLLANPDVPAEIKMDIKIKQILTSIIAEIKDFNKDHFLEELPDVARILKKPDFYKTTIGLLTKIDTFHREIDLLVKNIQTQQRLLTRVQEQNGEQKRYPQLAIIFEEFNPRMLSQSLHEISGNLLKSIANDYVYRHKMDELQPHKHKAEKQARVDFLVAMKAENFFHPNAPSALYEFGAQAIPLLNTTARTFLSSLQKNLEQVLKEVETSINQYMENK